MANTRKITLSRALRLKNTLAGELQNAQGYFGPRSHATTPIRYSQEIGPAPEVKETLDRHNALTLAMVDLKTRISAANVPINFTIISMDNAKSRLSLINRILAVTDWSPKSLVRNGVNETVVVEHGFNISKEELEAEALALRAQINDFQDKLDEFNSTHKIEVPEQILADLGL